MFGYLRHLAHFARIVEAGSLKAASEHLNTAPSSLSDSVRILETRVGQPLLIRSRSGVSPTSEGERIYQSASVIIDQLEDALGSSNEKDVAGPCRISVPAELANTRFVRVLDYVRGSHPHIRMSVSVEDSVVDHSRFARDFFLRVSPVERSEPGLRRIWSSKTEAILVAAPNLIKGTDTNSRHAVETLTFLGSVGPTPSNLTFRQNLLIDAPATRLAMAREGLGVTTCLALCAQRDLTDGHLTRLLPDQFNLPIHITLATPHRRRSRIEAIMADACAHMMTDQPVPDAPDELDL